MINMLLIIELSISRCTDLINTASRLLIIDNGRIQELSMHSSKR